MLVLFSLHHLLFLPYCPGIVHTASQSDLAMQENNPNHHPPATHTKKRTPQTGPCCPSQRPSTNILWLSVIYGVASSFPVLHGMHDLLPCEATQIIDVILHNGSFLIMPSVIDVHGWYLKLWFIITKQRQLALFSRVPVFLEDSLLFCKFSFVCSVNEEHGVYTIIFLV